MPNQQPKGKQPENVEHDQVEHFIHGRGIVMRYSPSRTTVVVRYTTTKGTFYYRTHSVLSLKFLS